MPAKREKRPLARAVGKPGGMMIVACAWCDRVIGHKAPFEDESVTGGICHRCQERLIAEIVETNEKRELEQNEKVS